MGESSVHLEALRREFLDWDQRALPQAAAWLLGSSDAPVVDLSATCVVLPGARAGRVLLWQLAAQAQERGIRVAPPTVVTPGALVELLAKGGAVEMAGSASPASTGARAGSRKGAGELEAALTRASALASLLAFAEAIARAPDRVVSTLTPRPGRHSADSDSSRGEQSLTLGEALGLAPLLLRLQEELSNEGRTMEEAAEAARELAPHRLSEREEARWLAAAEIAAAARGLLGVQRLIDPAEAAWSALASGAITHPSARRIVLVTVVELTALQRRVLSSVMEGGGEVVALLHAAPTRAEAFDQFGCLRGEEGQGGAVWARPLIRGEDLTVVENAADAAQAALDALAVRRSRATIGLVDPSLAALLEQASAMAGVDVRSAAGRAMHGSETWRTLDAVSRLLERRGDAMLLARLPSAGRWLSRTLESASGAGVDLVEALDRAAAALRPGVRGGDAAILTNAERAVAWLLERLSGPARPLSAWAEAVRAIAAELLAALDPSPLERDAVELLVEELESWSVLPEALGPRFTGAQAVALLRSRLAARRLPSPVRRDEVDALGWLELHPDDAPELILLGLHEGCVPRVEAADPFLPDALRSAMGLPDDRRAARRDAYLLAAMQRGRVRVGTIVVRRGAAGDLVVGSRLLLEVPDAELADRVQRLAGRGSRALPEPRGLAAAAAQSRFVVPPAPLEPVHLASIRVTEFRAFLECPYRYWLRHRLGLEPASTAGDQLEPTEFGTLAHAVLQRWGRDERARELRDPARLTEALESALESEVARCFPGGAPVATLVQVARLRERLTWFAERQAAHRAEGWRVEAVEWPLPPGAALAVPEEPSVQIIGRVDRIDRHDDGRVLLLDYKTADRASTPMRQHVRGRIDETLRWVDLQLPLYGTLASPALLGQPWGPDEKKLAVGYFNLASQQSSTGLSLATWTAAQIAGAIETAQWVVSMIRLGRFVLSEQPAERSLAFDDFARICQARAMALPDGADETWDDQPEPEQEQEP
jgi:hypothetical protein